MNKKRKYILPAAGLLVIVLVVVFAVLLKKEAYRTIQVSKLEGSAEVDREDIGLLDAYMGMLLQNKDDVAVEEESYLYLKLDEDKYVMMEPETRFHLEASGNSENSKTVIYLEEGAVINRLDNKLSEESSYEIVTPNSTMAIRGTVFRVEVLPKADGTGAETFVSVYEGEVACSSIQSDGTKGDEVVLITHDQTIVVSNTEEETVIVTDPENVDYKELEQKVLEFILEAAQEKEDSGITQETEEMIRELLAEPAVYTVTFRYNGAVFATQQVKHGECATSPMLRPAPSGHWAFDFTEKITEDTDINWQE